MSNIRKVWITGSEGRVGGALKKLLDSRDLQILNTDIDDVDITNSQDVLNYGDMNHPDVIINCAGMTDISKCEQNPEKAYAVNALGARNLSISARRIGARLVHISTDDVFDGFSQKPYTEFDQPNPSTVYGKSKLAGENFIKEFAQKHYIIRSSWLYGDGDCFVNNIIAEAQKSKKVLVANDQFACPTSAHELAKMIILIMDTAEYGLYHGVCEGSCSRYDFAKEIFSIAKIDAEVIPAKAEDIPQSSKHPSFTVLDDFMLRISGIYKLPHWKTAIKNYLENRRV